MYWLTHYLRLIGSSLLLIFVVILVMFVLLQLAPGDPVQALVGNMPVTDAFRSKITAEYGLNQPMYEQFINYVGNILVGNFGDSFANKQPVLPLILGRLGNTLIITIPALILSTLGGIVLGALAAKTRSKWKDAGISLLAVGGFSLPNFWFALLLIMLFSVQLGWLPSQGMNSFGSKGVSISHMVMPIVALAIGEMAFKARLMRTSMIDVLGQDYIDTARSKGLSNGEIVRRHALLNSMLPMVSATGYSLGLTIAGSVLIEKVFGWPGMGLLLYDSIQRSENLVVMGILLIMTTVVVVINILTDIAYGLVDPRIRARAAAERKASK